MEKLNFRIGLDIGVGSVGWSVVKTDQNGEPCKIENLGVRIFTPAEHNDKGNSKPLALDRRVARGARRRLRRQKYRTEQMSKLLCKTFDFGIERSKDVRAKLNKILESKEFASKPQNNIYQIRHDALFQKIDDMQLAKVLLFFVKHRGYKSTSTAEENGDLSKAKDQTKMKGSLEKNKASLANLTVGEYIYQNYKVTTTKTLPDGQIQSIVTFDARNHGGEYSKCFYRSLIESEIRQILQKQKDFGNQKITKQFVDCALAIFNKQLNYDDGPNEPSQYRGLYKVGKCIFVPQENRAPKGAFSYEYFVALQKINQLSILTQNGKEFLSNEQKQLIASKLFEKQEIKYKDIRKIVGMSQDAKFVALSYPKPSQDDQDGKKQKNPEDAKFVSMVTTYKISKALLQDKIDKNCAKLYDKIAEILSFYKSDDNRLLQFEQSAETKNLSAEQKANLLKLNSSKFGNVSLMAIDRILPFLEQGDMYHEAVQKAGFNFCQVDNGNATKHKKIIFDENLKNYLDDITNPVVRRALGQTIKVVNAIIDKYGSPEAIFVELARDIKKTLKERANIKKKQDEREQNNKSIEDKLKQIGIEPTSKNMQIYKLYIEQDGKSAYSGKPILQSIGVNNGDIRYLFDKNYVQVDHIVPYSKSYDDSWDNKVLVLTKENQDKGNRTPLEWLNAFPSQKQTFLDFVATTYSNKQKKTEHLLSASTSDQMLESWRSASLNDTRSIAVFAKDLFERFLLFAPGKYTHKVRCVNGQVTSYLGKVWNIEKTRAKDDRHHARDACLIAVATNSTLQKVTEYFKLKYLYKNKLLGKLQKGPDGKEYYPSKETGEMIEASKIDMFLTKEFGKFVPQPYPTFANEVKARLSDDPSRPQLMGLDAKDCYANTEYDNQQIANLKPIFISQMPNRKANGKIHDDTIYSDSGRMDKSGKMVVTKKVPITKLELTKDKTAIKDYNQESKISDPNTYNVLFERLKQFDGDAGKAFAEPVFKKTKDGRPGNQIKKVKLEEGVGNTISTPRGIVLGGKMLRLDIYKKNNKYYGVPVYVSDKYFGILPTKVCSAHKDESMWDDVSNGYDFCFSLYPGDLFYLESKGGFSGTKQEDKKTKQNFCKGLFYYKNFDRDGASISFKNHDDSFEFRHCFQSAVKFEKYVVDILGEYHKVDKEKQDKFLNIKKGDKYGVH